MTQSQGRVPGHGALAIQDCGYAVSWHLDPARQFSRAHVQFFKLCGIAPPLPRTIFLAFGLRKRYI
jgi:hypothetical protein